MHQCQPYLESDEKAKGDDFRLVGVKTSGGDSLSESEDTTMTSLALSMLALWLCFLFPRVYSCSAMAPETW